MNGTGSNLDGRVKQCGAERLTGQHTRAELGTRPSRGSDRNSGFDDFDLWLESQGRAESTRDEA
jgi:hypothetical protein